MATPEIYENCYYVQNDAHRCEIKLEKFHFDILCCFGVIKESLLGGGGEGIRPPGEIGLSVERLSMRRITSTSPPSFPFGLSLIAFPLSTSEN